MKLKDLLIKRVIPIVLIFVVGGLAGFFINQKLKPKEVGKSENKDKYVAFVDEVYVTIKDNHWKKMEEKDLVDLFIRASEQISGQIQTKQIKDKVTMDKTLQDIISKYDSDEKKKGFVASLSDAVLTNLEPRGRSRLYTEKDEVALANTVNNITPEADRYKDLGITKDATPEEIEKAYVEKAKENPVVAKKAYDTLSDTRSRELYDAAGIEPTMEYHTIGSTIFYIHLSKFSPTTVEELQRVGSKVAGKPDLNTLIIDLRGNIGGAIDGLPFFLGPFIGPDQYAYQFFHQGEKEDYKTKSGYLPEYTQYKKVIFLIDGQSQSTAEVMAATVKKYHVGIVVGVPSKGWGTVEKVFKMNSKIADNESYSIFLVHSLTLREDGNPIEGRGVDPVVNIQSPTWKKELFSYFDSNEIVNAVNDLVTAK
jgi:hypothetical protein